MNALELLKADHKKMRGLLSDLEATTKRATVRRIDLLDTIEKELSIHARIEEEIFYPAFKEAAEKQDDAKMYFEALEEHRAVEDMVLPDLKATDPATDQFSGRAKVLKELIEHHADEEEKEMFPRVRQLLSATELQQLGAAMQEMKATLLPGPAPKLGVGKKLIRAVVSALDGDEEPAGRRAPSDGPRSPRAAPTTANGKSKSASVRS